MTPEERVDALTPAPLDPPPYDPWRQMKPNKMWPEEIRLLIRGYVAAPGEKLAPCLVCGSKKRGRWTMLCPFVAHTLQQFTTVPSAELPPLTLVCNDHPLAPAEAIGKAL